MTGLENSVLEETVTANIQNDALYVTVKNSKVGITPIEIRYILTSRGQDEFMELRFPNQSCKMKVIDTSLVEVSVPGDGPYRMTKEEQYGLQWEAANPERTDSHQRLQKAQGLWNRIHEQLHTNPAVRKAREDYLRATPEKQATTMGRGSSMKKKYSLTEELLQFKNMADPLDVLLQSIK